MQLKALHMLAGYWLCKTEKYETEELWQEPKASLMLGLNRTVSNVGKTAFEFLRIFQTKNEIFYAASPSGKPATHFKLIESSDNKLVFENLEYDYPQRIIYNSNKENELSAKIEGDVDGINKQNEWIFKRIDNKLLK
jgi:Domain of unknown function (DUF6265)